MNIKARPKQQLEMLIIAMEALCAIKHKEGKVCINFGTCNHDACRSSYSSWYIADEALKAIRSTEE